jgi:transcriptional regulator with XRE-family HTH domain
LTTTLTTLNIGPMVNKINKQQTLSEKLRQFRLENGLSYKELAEKIGVDEGAVRKIILRETEKPHELTVFKIQKALPELFKAA